MTAAADTASVTAEVPGSARLLTPVQAVDLGALLLVLAQLAAYAAVALPGSFYLDDLASGNRAAAADLGWAYLRGPAGHHLAPAASLAMWLQTHLAPLDHTAAVGSLLVVQAVVSVAMWRLLRLLFGPRPLALLPLAVYALSPLSVPTFAWWIQAVCLLPVHLSVIGATHQHVRYVRTRRLRHALAAGGCVLLGLLFWEKAVLAVALPVLLTVVALTEGPGLRRRVVWLLRLWPAWLSLAAAPAAFAAFYSTQQRQPARPVPAAEVGRLMWDSSTHMVLPSLLGGPWRWTTKEFYGIARPTGGQVVATLVLVVLAVLLTVRRRRAAWRGWALLALYVPASLAPVAAGRLAQYGTAVGRDSRYVTDIAVAAAVALGLVLMPLRPGPAERVAPPAHAVVRRRRTALRRAAVAALALAWLASAAVSDARFAHRWQQNPTGDYLAHLTGDLRAADGSTPLYDGSLPPSVLSAFYEPWNGLSALLRQLPGEARFEDGLVPLQVVRPDGHVVAGQLSVAARSPRGPDGSCGYAIRPGTPGVTVPLGRSLFDFVGRTVRVELLLSAPTAVRVEVGDGTDRRRVGDGRVLPRGPAAVVALAPGGDLSQVEVGGLAPGAAACVLSVTVGTPAPLARS